jgi:hypothetical protein
MEGLGDEPRPGRPPHGHRRACREGDYRDTGAGAAEQGHTLVDAVDGQVRLRVRWQIMIELRLLISHLDVCVST